MRSLLTIYGSSVVKCLAHGKRCSHGLTKIKCIRIVCATNLRMNANSHHKIGVQLPVMINDGFWQFSANQAVLTGFALFFREKNIHMPKNKLKFNFEIRKLKKLVSNITVNNNQVL